jgi:hypothetical protein
VIPNITRGASMVGVVRYLLGPGRREEHVAPRLVAGSPEAVLMAGGRPLEVGDAASLGRHLDEPRTTFGTRVTIAERDSAGRVVGLRDAHVWHCSLSLHPDEPALKDGRWAEIAERFVARMGFAGEEAPAQCRWAAIRHGRSAGGSDHVHLVVGLVSDDGSKASVHYDCPRAQEACRALEAQFHLRRVEGRGRGAGERGVRAGELAADRRRGRPVGDRGQDTGSASRRVLERAVRACAVAAVDEGEFVTRLEGEGVLVRPRYGAGGRGEVTGYSVALPATAGRRSVWYGGGRLSRELTLPRLRSGWATLEGDALSAAWRAARGAGPRWRRGSAASPELQARCARELAQMRVRLRDVPAGDHGTWAHVAREAAGVLAAWSLRAEREPGPLAEAARAVARTGQLRRERVRRRRWHELPPARRAAQLLLAASGPAGDGVLAREVVGLALALRDMHAAAGELERAAELGRALPEGLAARVADESRMNRHRRGPGGDARGPER